MSGMLQRAKPHISSSIVSQPPCYLEGCLYSWVVDVTGEGELWGMDSCSYKRKLKSECHRKHLLFRAAPERLVLGHVCRDLNH